MSLFKLKLVITKGNFKFTLVPSCTFQVFNSYAWLVVTSVDSTYVGHFYHCGNAIKQCCLEAKKESNE